jgi:hypothetical protein
MTSERDPSAGSESELDAQSLQQKKLRLAAATLGVDFLALPFANSPEIRALSDALEVSLVAARKAGEDDYLQVLGVATKLLAVLRYGRLPPARAREVGALEAALNKLPVARAESPDRLSKADAVTYLCEITLRLLQPEPVRRVGRWVECSECGEEFEPGSAVCWTQRISHEEPGPLQHQACARATRGRRFARCFARFLYAMRKNPAFAPLLPDDLYNADGEIAAAPLARLTSEFEDLLERFVGAKVQDPMADVQTFVERGLVSLGAHGTAAHDALASWRMRDQRSYK